jgi:hypothetical protein
VHRQLNQKVLDTGATFDQPGCGEASGPEAVPVASEKAGTGSDTAMKFQDAARARIDEDASVVRPRRVSITLFKERLYRVRPRVEHEKVGVEHGTKGRGVVEPLAKGGALQGKGAQTPALERAARPLAKVEKADAANQAGARRVLQAAEGEIRDTTGKVPERE